MLGLSQEAARRPNLQIRYRGAGVDDAFLMHLTKEEEQRVVLRTVARSGLIFGRQARLPRTR